MSIVYYHLNLIDSTAGCCCCCCFSLQCAESLANTIYSLLCPLNTSFRPSPLCFSAHTYFFSSWTSLQNPLQRMCKNGWNEPTQVIYVDIRRDNDALLKDSEVFHILSQFCRHVKSCELSKALKCIFFPKSYIIFHRRAIQTWFM